MIQGMIKQALSYGTKREGGGRRKREREREKKEREREEKGEKERDREEKGSETGRGEEMKKFNHHLFRLTSQLIGKKMRFCRLKEIHRKQKTFSQNILDYF